MVKTIQTTQHTERERYNYFLSFENNYLAVSRKELTSLGVIDQISKKSYMSKLKNQVLNPDVDNVFLESTKDMLIFVRAIQKKDPSWRLEGHLIILNGGCDYIKEKPQFENY